MSGTIAELGIAVDSGDAAQAATDLDKLTAAGVKAEKAADDVTAGFKKTADAADKLAAAEARAAQATDEAKARLLEVAKASLQNSEYYQRLTTSVTSTTSAMDESGSSAASLAALQRRLQAESDALVGANQQSAQAAKQAAAATGVQAEGLQALLAKINPTIAAYERLDQQQEQLKQHLKAGNIDSDQFKAYSADIERTRDKLGGFDESLKKTGVSSAQTSAALRQLPAQFSDIFTSLAGGQNPLLVLVQQGSQIKDSFGGIENTFDALKTKFKSLFSSGTGAAALGESLAGIAANSKEAAESAGEASESISDLAESSNTAAEAAENAKKALGTIQPAVAGASLGFLGMAAAVLGAAAAVGVLIYGYSQGSKEADEYNQALILTGNYAGTSAGQLANLAQQVSATNGTVGQAAETLAKLAGSGSIAGESFQAIAEAASLMEDATGKSIDATIAEFAKIAKDPVSAAKELNDQYHFLTASVYAQIVALKEQGDVVGAADLLTKTYADTVQARSKQVTDNLGLWERAWKGVKDAAAGAVDGLNNIGREKTLDQQIADLKSSLTGSDAFDVGGLRMNAGAVSQKDRADIQAQINLLELRKEGESALNKYIGERARIQGEAIEASIKVKGITESTLTAEQKRTKESAEYLRNVEKIRAANPDAVEVQPATVAKALANIKDKYKDPKGPANQLDLTGFNDAQNNLKSITGYYQNLEKELDSAQKARLVSAESYSSQRVAIVEQEKGDLTAAYEAEISALESVRDKSSTTAQQRIQLDQKIADARTSMVKAQKDADSQLEVLANNEKGRIDKQTRSITQYVQALDQQQRALELAGQRAVLGVGRGDRQNALDAQLNSQQDRFAQQSLDLENQKSDPSRNMSEEEFAKKSQALADANKKATDQIRRNYADVQTAQGDWTNGATSAWENYLDSAKDIAGQTKSLFTNAFSSMEDAVVNFALTGKLSFSDFTKSVISDLARIAARKATAGIFSSAFGLVSSAAGSYFGGSGTAGSSQSDYTGSEFQDYVAGQRATGGDVAPNSLYQVNELGPELFSQGGKSYLMTGADGGSVTPLGSGRASVAAGTGAAGVAPNVYISIASDGSSQVGSDTTGLEAFGKQIGEIAAQKYRELEAKSLSSQGNIRQAINGRR
jgi:lambda family phage tail tape measure protein